MAAAFVRKCGFVVSKCTSYAIPVSRMPDYMGCFVRTRPALFFVPSSCQHIGKNGPTTDEQPNTGDQKNEEEKKHAVDQEDHEDNVKAAILNASLPWVNQHGWSSAAVEAGAVSLGYSGIAHSLFPDAGLALVHHFYGMCNKGLEEKLKQWVAEVQLDNNEQQKNIRLFVQDAVWLRLQMNVPYMTKWPEALGLLALPQNSLTTLPLVWSISDHIWHYAGDRSTDANWYLKRASLSAIYQSTELCMVQDSSEKFRQTSDFLNRRLNEADAVGKVLTNLDTTMQGFASNAKAAVETLKNILGANSSHR